MIYIAALLGFTSGGPELLHQLASVLRLMNLDSRMIYYTNQNAFTVAEAPEVYRKYQTVAEEDLTRVDSSENVIVFPETALTLMNQFHKCGRIIWWMSVDNYVNLYQKMFDNIDPFHLSEDTTVFHLVQSRYALEFIMHQLKISEERIAYLSDYINDTFMKEQPHKVMLDENERAEQNQSFGGDKKDIVIYNPQKGARYLEILKEYAPEIKWIPIEHMTPEQVSGLLSTAKVYIDLGTHPGKDRIPREAAMSGCCVITNKMGAAAYYEDIPIPDQYKFEDVPGSLVQIKCLIKDIFRDYEGHYSDFDDYRTMIASEKQWFVEDVIHIFQNQLWK